MAKTTTREVRTYDPASINFQFMGTTITGYMDGTFINVATEGDTFEKHRGADGSIDRVNRNSFSYRVTLTLKRTAPSNVILQGYRYADSQSNRGAGSLDINDSFGTSLFHADTAWIAKEPDQPNSDSMDGRVWEFDTGIALTTPGGNNLSSI